MIYVDYDAAVEAAAADRRRAQRAAARRLIGFAFAVAGYLMAGYIWYWGVRTGFFPLPGSDAQIWDRAGDEIRAGISPYYQVPGSGGFYFAPPWAIAFAAVSWLPPAIPAAALIVLEAGALWYIAGSWTRVGWCLLWPFVAFELPSSQVNLLIAGAIAAAVRGDSRAALVLAAAKLSPIFAIDPRQWRRLVPVGLVLLAMTIPFLGLWADWIAQLTRNVYSVNAPRQLVIPIWPRLAVAAVLFMTGRPWARGLAAIVAIPLPYLISSVLFLGLIPPLRQRACNGRLGALSLRARHQQDAQQDPERNDQQDDAVIAARSVR
jgi:hypothetical protein